MVRPGERIFVVENQNIIYTLRNEDGANVIAKYTTQ